MKPIIHHMDPLTDDDAVMSPLPRRLEHRDPMLEPVRLGAPLRGILIGVLLGLVGWVVIFTLIYLAEEVL